VTRPSTATEADPTPTPAPASERRLASTGPSSTRVAVDADLHAADLHDADLIERFAHCRSLDELPPELRDNPLIRHLVSMTPEDEARELAAVTAHREANELYGDDPARILAAIAAGTHPLQRRPLAHR